VAFQYKKRDAGAWEKRASQQGGDYQGFIVDEAKVYTPKKGDNFVRILPPTFENADHYGIDVWVHYGIGPDRASAICLQKMKNMPCPLCEARARAERGGDEDLAGELKPSRRVMVYMLDRKDEAAGPQVWSMPWTLDREVCKISRDKRTGQVYAIDDPNEGYDLSFEREGEGMMVKYAGIQLSRRPSSRRCRCRWCCAGVNTKNCMSYSPAAAWSRRQQSTSRLPRYRSLVDLLLLRVRQRRPLRQKSRRLPNRRRMSRHLIRFLPVIPLQGR
jgi:hypothetical protein